MTDNKNSRNKVFSYINMLLSVMLGGLILCIFGILFGALLKTEDIWGMAPIGILVAYPIGAIAALVLIYKVLKYQGSLALGITGVLFADIITGCLFSILKNLDSVYPLIVVYIVAPAILATVGYHINTNRKSKPIESNLDKNDT